MGEVIAVVHAKGKSRRLPNKNTRLLGGIPLICHSIRNAQKAQKVDKVVVDSDSDNILEIADKCGAITLKRPSELASNVATGDDLAYWQASNFPKSDVIVQVVPTSPFTSPDNIDMAISIVNHVYKPANSCCLARNYQLYTWEDGKPSYIKDGRILNSNELPTTVVEHTGMYAFRTKFVLENKKRIDVNNNRFLFASLIEAIDIDYEEDFQFAEIVYRGMHPERFK